MLGLARDILPVTHLRRRGNLHALLGHAEIPPIPWLEILLQARNVAQAEGLPELLRKAASLVTHCAIHRWRQPHSSTIQHNPHCALICVHRLRPGAKRRTAALCGRGRVAQLIFKYFGAFVPASACRRLHRGHMRIADEGYVDLTFQRGRATWDFLSEVPAMTFLPVLH